LFEFLLEPADERVARLNVPADKGVAAARIVQAFLNEDPPPAQDDRPDRDLDHSSVSPPQLRQTHPPSRRSAITGLV
jgi:hypothetical protein